MQNQECLLHLERGDIEQHLDECGLAPVKCVNDEMCSWNGNREDIDSHLLECDGVVVMCSSRDNHEESGR